MPQVNTVPAKGEGGRGWRKGRSRRQQIQAICWFHVNFVPRRPSTRRPSPLEHHFTERAVRDMRLSAHGLHSRLATFPAPPLQSKIGAEEGECADRLFLLQMRSVRGDR